MARRRRSPGQRRAIAILLLALATPVAWYTAVEARRSGTELAYYQRPNRDYQGFAQQVETRFDGQQDSRGKAMRRLELQREHGTWLMLAFLASATALISAGFLIVPVVRGILVLVGGESGSRPAADGPRRRPDAH